METTNVKRLALGIGTVTLAPLLGCGGADLYCTAGHGDFAVEYRLIEGDGPCAELPGDVVGFATYQALKDGLPDYGDISLALQPARVYDLETAAIEAVGAYNEYNEAHALEVQEFTPDADEDRKYYSYGDVANTFPERDFCEVPEFDVQPLKTVPGYNRYLFTEDDPETPDVDESLDDPKTPDVDESLAGEEKISRVTYSYAWRDLRLYVTPEAQGTQFLAEFTYREVVEPARLSEAEAARGVTLVPPGASCEARFEAVGVYPAVPCTTNDECRDDKSGINPDFAVECHEALGLCVLSKDPPSLE